MPKVEIPADQVFPVLKENILVDGFHVVIDLEKSHGAVIVDALQGKEYLDCYGYFATLPVGHNHPKLRDEGFRESLMRAALANPTNSDMYSREFAAFVKTFRALAVPAEFRYLFFVAGGGLAVENTMKAAFDWKAQKNRARGVEGGADKILHFRDAFHGRTGYTLSVTNTDPTKTDDFPQFDWPRISSPYIDFPMDEQAVAAKEEVAYAEIEAAFEHDPDGIAAILIEPIQAEGGDHHFRPDFFAKLREYADRYEALLIFDEVQTGLGATGTMWAYEQTGVVPDLIAFGKKTQVCGMMSTRRIDEIESNVFHVSSRINSTWGGTSPTWSGVPATWRSSTRTASWKMPPVWVPCSRRGWKPWPESSRASRMRGAKGCSWPLICRTGRCGAGSCRRVGTGAWRSSPADRGPFDCGRPSCFPRPRPARRWGRSARFWTTWANGRPRLGPKARPSPDASARPKRAKG